MIPVQDQPNWFRDESGAIVNSDTTEYQNFLKRKDAVEAKSNEIVSMKNQINTLNNSVENLSDKLNQILSLLQGSK